MTNEQLLSIYIKSLRPVKKQDETSNTGVEEDTKDKEEYISTKEENSLLNYKNMSSSAINSCDTISSYYKYIDNGKIEMVSTGDMNINEAFDLLRYKIKILRKQLEIERKAREEITEDYMTLREELQEWIKKAEVINENFILERDANMEKDDYIQLLEEKIKMYENLIQRHNEVYPNDSIPNAEDSKIIE